MKSAASSGRGHPPKSRWRPARWWRSEVQSPPASGSTRGQTVNLPADRIRYNIDKATGNQEGVNYEEIPLRRLRHRRCEAVILDTMTDNRITHRGRGAPRLQLLNGGNLGTEGSGGLQFALRAMGVLLQAPAKTR